MSLTNLGHIALDIGSTTVKIVLLDENGDVIYGRYRRHLSDTRSTLANILREALADPAFTTRNAFTLSTSGSGAIALAEEEKLPFVQEVIASATCIRRRIENVDVTIELGGEDAKITFFTGGVEQRMNETCAGGTGAFIDQMAAFLNTDAPGLDALARNHKTLYPIASRCGVFAKTDILPLLNEGCAKEDIAASIFQAVVDQVVGGLACGREIKGNVAFLGGPLAFLPALQRRFTDSLALEDPRESMKGESLVIPQPQGLAIFPEYAEYFVAMGAALTTMDEHTRKPREVPLWNKEDLAAIAERILSHAGLSHSQSLPPLFPTEKDWEEFNARHEADKAPRATIDTLEGTPEKPALTYLGIDIGSTTIKAVLLTEKGEILYSFYHPSQGEPLLAAVDILKEVYALLPTHARIAAAGVTGYGSALIRAALHADVDEVETLAHSKAAQYFLPDVSFILDIGGQDIKCLHIKDGQVDKIQLNEACSSGCGSFIETFAKSLGMSLEDFVKEALAARHPVDLGTRCTVFMNSKVKQAQKEGSPVGDIAAGLSYSVIRNALYKVIKISSPEELGAHVMAQGGSFYNDALLRALELHLQRPVMRLDIAGLMGAFGAARIAQERREDTLADLTEEEKKTPFYSSLLSLAELNAFEVKSTVARCQQCTNHCLLTVSRFPDGTRFVSGNRCERGAGKTLSEQKLPNVYEYKYQRLFSHYVPRKNAPRGKIGFPRALNMYENYPLWFTLFTELGYEVVLSAPSSKDIFNLGLSTIPSQTVCYPAKLAHGHVLDLLAKGVRTIFYPCIPHEQKEFDSQDNQYNCPVVGGYPELLQNNLDALRTPGIELICPFLSLAEGPLLRSLVDLPLFANLGRAEIKAALAKAFAEQQAYKADIRAAGEAALARLAQTKGLGIVLVGHPYHIDPEVHHGIPELITSTGLAVLTEDSIAHLAPPIARLRVVDQWTYHARLYRAAAFVGENHNLSLVQLVSFGCGLDAVTADQVEEILAASGRNYTQIKIDEGANLGAARIRVRSLLATMTSRRKTLSSLHTLQQAENHQEIPLVSSFGHPVLAPLPKEYRIKTPSFTEEMRSTHTILIPQMSPLHFQFFPTILNALGYKAELLPTVSREALETGLKYVHNDACYPAITVIGQLIHAVQSGKYDQNNLALILSQTGGGCRATNYIAFLKKALANAGLTHLPVLSFNIYGMEENPGFHLDWALLKRAIMACLYGDVLMRVIYRIRPYEAVAGSTNTLAAEWAERVKPSLVAGSLRECYRNIRSLVRDFDTLPLKPVPRKPRVGLVGEILLKFHPDANNGAAEIVEAEGGEAVLPDLMDFALYSLYDDIFRYKHLGQSKKSAKTSGLMLGFLLTLRQPLRSILKKSKRFTPPLPFSDLRKLVKGVVSLGHQTGEGWLLTAEMIELLHEGVPNILCMQPFGCLPNHITGKGVLKEIKRRFPHANIAAVDYDPGASEVNQINRIKLMMSVAREG